MKKFKVGVQLYGLRSEMAKDMENVFKKVKEMGYECVEFAGFSGERSLENAKKIRELTDKYGLTIISVHQGPDAFEKDPETAIKFLQILGAKYCAIPWFKVDNYIDNWDGTIEKFKALGELLKKNGIQLMYHNHDFEFTIVDGEHILDKLYNTIPNSILKPEFDTCWVHYAGQSPAEYILKNVGQIDLVHLKDFYCKELGGSPVYGLIGDDGAPIKKNNYNDNGFLYKALGEGMEDFKPIIDACEKAGVQYLIVEQDEWYDESPFDCCARSRQYLKETFGI